MPITYIYGASPAKTSEGVNGKNEYGEAISETLPAYMVHERARRFEFALKRNGADSWDPQNDNSP
jgi:hypothetical protein